jgi:hypothetical protein
VRRLEVKVFNGSFGHPGVLLRLRRKLERSAAMGQCLLVDGEGVDELSPIQVHALFAGLPPEKVRPVGFPALRPFPLPLKLPSEIREKRTEGR